MEPRDVSRDVEGNITAHKMHPQEKTYSCLQGLICESIWHKEKHQGLRAGRLKFKSLKLIGKLADSLIHLSPPFPGLCHFAAESKLLPGDTTGTYRRLNKPGFVFADVRIGFCLCYRV